MFNRKNPIVFILVVLCSLEVLLASRIYYTDYIDSQEGRLVYDQQGKITGIQLGDYKSDFSFSEIPEEDLEEFRSLEKATRRVLNISDEYYADVENLPRVKIYDYSNKNWQYFIMTSLNCGYNTYEGTEKHQPCILLSKSIYSNPTRRRQTYIHEYIHFLSNQGSALTVKEADHFNSSLTEAYTEMLSIKVLKEMQEKYIYKTRYDRNVKIAERLEKASKGAITKIFFRFSKVNLLAENLEEYQELAILAEKRQSLRLNLDWEKEQKRIDEILEYYETKTIW